MVRRNLVALAVVLLSGGATLTGGEASALDTCANTEVIGVRGSGQLYGYSKELSAVKALLPTSIKFNELENKIHFLEHEQPYEAISVAHDPLTLVESGGVALLTHSKFGEYRKSVDSGKNLLKKYIEHYQPTNTCLVLVGYSQGAQVIGETVRDMHKTDPYSLKNVIYIGLLGDPQYSPYGFDTTREPAWLRGDALYPYTGTLGAREPEYVPHNPSKPLYPFTKIGSWCNYGDVVCAVDVDHYTTMRDGHGTYTGSSTVEMVDEIKAAIATPDQNITGSLYPTSVCGAEKQDLVVLLDTSAYMRRDKDLFTKDKNTLDTKLIPGTTQKMLRTFGEQLLGSGCGDKRVAIVGFEGPSKGQPKVLLDFTTDPHVIDNLMSSLYQPSAGGAVEKPQLREAAIIGMKQGWRSDASRTLLAISPMAGSGSVSATWRESWMSPGVMDRYMNDAVGQEFLEISRRTQTAMITALHLPVDMSGFTVPSGYPGSGDAYSYFQGLTRLTGGYNWEKKFHQYLPSHTVKNVDFSNQILQFEKRRDGTRVAMKSVSARVGHPVTLSLEDTANLLASAGVRRHGVATEWYLNCDALQTQTIEPVLKRNNVNITFTPAKPGVCIGAVRVAVQGDGNGCYWGCPEPFPPYILKMIPFKIDIRPADYVEKVPANILVMAKAIHDDRVEISWEPPVYNGDKLVYFIKDTEGAVLAVSTVERATITDTNIQDVEVLVQAIGRDGRSDDLSTHDKSVVAVDKRTQLDDVVASPSPTIGSPVNNAAQVVRTETQEVVSFEKIPEIESSDGQTLGHSVVAASDVHPPHSHRDRDVKHNAADSWWWLLLLAVGTVWTTYCVRAVIRRG